MTKTTQRCMKSIKIPIDDPNTKPLLSRADVDVVRYIRLVAKRLAQKFKIKMKNCTIIPIDSPNIKDSMGLCEYENGNIFFNLYKAQGNTYYAIDTLIDTIVHELAHLKLSSGLHNRVFKRTCSEMLSWYYKDSRQRNI